ncbi:hypothetical protein SDC9_130088 [bioreactor metagenome]|uniref:Uncharacterized protein n=1 Tax=bioreactor metagenome TaxID=1076179 RepID=A0A645D1J9_9ZZZZ
MPFRQTDDLCILHIRNSQNLVLQRKSLLPKVLIREISTDDHLDDRKEVRGGEVIKNGSKCSLRQSNLAETCLGILVEGFEDLVINAITELHPDYRKSFAGG